MKPGQRMKNLWMKSAGFARAGFIHTSAASTEISIPSARQVQVLHPFGFSRFIPLRRPSYQLSTGLIYLKTC